MNVLDDNGFPFPGKIENYQCYVDTMLPKQKEKDDIWFDYIKKIGGSAHIDVSSAEFKKMVRMGIPKDHRPTIWTKITGLFSMMIKHKDAYTQALASLEAVPDGIKQAIEVDIPRTFPRSISFKPEPLKRILIALAILHPEIGYCQSMNFIAAICLYVMQREEEAFWLMAIIIENYIPKEYFVPSMFDFQVDLLVEKMLISERVPDIYSTGEKINFNWITITSNWLLTLFSNCFPISTVLRIWDSFLLEGQKVIFRVSLGFLKMYQSELVDLSNKDFRTKINELQANLIDQDRLMEISFGLRVFSSSHINELRMEAYKTVTSKGISGQPNSVSRLHFILGQMDL